MPEGYYPVDCEEQIPAHNCDPCNVTELAKIRSIAFIKKDVVDSIKANPSNPVAWNNAVLLNNNSCIVIPFVNGELQDPAEVLLPGYGNQSERLVAYDFIVVFNDPNYKENCDFYNKVKKSPRYYLAYCTETQVHITGKPVTIIPKAPIANDENAEITWNVTCKWREKDHPCPNDIPEDVFDECYIQGE